MRRRAVARFAAPAAFLLAATIAVLLVRAGLEGGDPGRESPESSRPAVEAPGRGDGTTTKPAQYRIVRSGDTLESIAQRFGTTSERLRELNPGVEPTALRPGQRIRVR